MYNWIKINKFQFPHYSSTLKISVYLWKTCKQGKKNKMSSNTIFLHKVQHQHTAKIQKYYHIAACLLGYGEIENRILKFLLNIFLFILVINLGIYSPLFFWNVVHYAGEIVIQFQYGIMFIIVLPMCLFYFFLITHKSTLENHMKWCEILHEKLSHEGPEILDLANKTAEESAEGFRKSIVFLPGICQSGILFQGIILAIQNRRLMPVLQYFHVPLVPDGQLNALAASINILISVPAICLAVAIVLNLMFMVIDYSITGIRSLEILVNTKEDLTQIIDVSSDILNELDSFSKITRGILLTNEISTYGCFLLIWVAVFLEPELVMIALNCVSLNYLYILVCQANERLDDAFAYFHATLYDLEWHTMKFEKRRCLLLIMIMANRPKFMQSGPFHPINFEGFAFLLKRIFSIGMILNKFAAN